MRVDMQGPVWLSGGEEGFYASAFFLGLLVILAWCVQRPFPSEFNVNPLFSEGFGGPNYPWLTMDRCGHCRRSWSESESPSVGSRDVPN